MKSSIDAITLDVTKLHLLRRVLAKARNIEAEKLENGLGLLKMKLLDLYQDSVVFGAKALTKLIIDPQIKLDEIARIYAGSNSAIDNSNTTSSFLLKLMKQKVWRKHPNKM